MPTTNEFLSKLTRLSGFAIIALGLWLPAVPAQAAELTIKGKSYHSKPESTWVQIGDDKGHGIGTYETFGLAIQDDGQVGTFTNKGSYDSNKDAEHHRGYFVLTFPDGSTLTDHYQGNSWKEGEFTVWEGTGKVIAGTGRFENVKGDDSYQGRRYSNGMAIVDWEYNLVLPD